MITSTATDYRRVTARALNVRNKPGLSGDIIGVVGFGYKALVLDEADNWLTIGYEGGEAYIAEWWTTSFWWQAWPTDYEVVTQQFGKRPYYYKQFGLPGHEGVDIRAPLNTPIYAVSSGEVYRVSDKTSSGAVSNYGWHVRVDHQNGYKTIYAHLAREALPANGEWIQAGWQLGISGNTGNTSGPHLHLTQKKDGGQKGWPWGIVDPMPQLKLWEFDNDSSSAPG